MKAFSLAPLLMGLGVQKTLSPPKTSLDIALTPKYEHGSAVAVVVEMRFNAPTSSVPTNILFSVDKIAEIPALHIKDNHVDAWDEDGQIYLTPIPESSMPQISAYYWIPSRTPRGSIRISYTALPRQVTNATRSGPALDFRGQDGGLLGAGFGLLCAPSDFTATYDVRLRWDLSLGPAETEASWTFGDGLEAERSLSPMSLLSTYFAVGHVKAYSPECSDTDQKFNIYWLGEPPFDVCKVGDDVKSIFYSLGDFFLDQEDSYRVFLRHNPYPGTNTGTALERSFMFSYDDSDYVQRSNSVYRVMILAHEIVHNWVKFSEDSESTASNWYAEGLAEYYSIFLLFKNGIISEKVLLDGLNRRLHAYYTNPMVNKSNEEAAEHTWSSTAAQRLPYRRGLVFAILLNDIIWKGSKERYSLDDAVLDVLKTVRLGQTIGPYEYIEKCAHLASDRAGVVNKIYRQMATGEGLLVPSETSLSWVPTLAPVILRCHQQYVFELGFDEMGARIDHIIRGLKPTSRAAQMGLQNGDHLVGGVQLNESDMDYEKTIAVEVKRPGLATTFHVNFWPRGHETVKSCFYEFYNSDHDL